MIIKEWTACGFAWRLVREQYKIWYYLERDGVMVAEGQDRKALLQKGWYE